MITQAINDYHEMLAPIAEETQAQMQALAKEKKAYFGENPVCRVLRPHFYFNDQWEYLAKRTNLVLSAFSKAHQACMENEKMRVQLALEPYEEELFSLDTDRIKVPWSSSRLDAFYRVETGYLRFVEYNAETPAGIGYGDELTDVFMGLEVMRRFQTKYEVYKTYGLPQLLGVILRGYSDWGGRVKPQIAIVDWKEVPTRNEQIITQNFFERQGYKTILADPREMEYKDGKLYSGDVRVDIVYKRVLISELIERMGMNSPLVRAVKDHAVFMTNSFSAKLLAKKASLALLSDEANGHLFNIEERSAIEQHIPWTRIVQDRKTIYQAQEVELLRFISDNRNNLVLKPNDEYGGSGVVIGWECSTEDWDKAIQHALTVSYVVQERVHSVQRDFPQMLNGSLEISPRHVDTDPYVFYGQEVGGCLTRLSSETLLNVTAGTGSVVPMFVISPKG